MQLASIDYDGVYRSLMGFYMWPVAYSESTKHVLDMLRVERKSRGEVDRSCRKRSEVVHTPTCIVVQFSLEIALNVTTNMIMS